MVAESGELPLFRFEHCNLVFVNHNNCSENHVLSGTTLRKLFSKHHLRVSHIHYISISYNSTTCTRYPQNMHILSHENKHWNNILVRNNTKQTYLFLYAVNIHRILIVYRQYIILECEFLGPDIDWIWDPVPRGFLLLYYQLGLLQNVKWAQI
jgi:hypothetical protein